MGTPLRLFALLTLTAAASWAPLQAQESAALMDTVVTWRSTHADVEAPVRVFASPDRRRPYCLVLDDRADYGRPLTDDARFLAESLGRALGLDPAEVTFVFRYTAASFSRDAQPGGRTLLVRATFGRNRNGRLAAPTWRLITAEELSVLTDRAL